MIFVMRTELGPIESKEPKAIALKNAIQEGLNSPLVAHFDFHEHLKKSKLEKRKDG
jgi:antitoxin ParD1/3/4